MGLYSEGLFYGRKFAFWIDWVYRFCFVLLCNWGQFSKYKSGGGLFLEGRFNGGFLCYRFEGPIFGGAYKWRAYFRNFTVSVLQRKFCWLGTEVSAVLLGSEVLNLRSRIYHIATHRHKLIFKCSPPRRHGGSLFAAIYFIWIPRLACLC